MISLNTEKKQIDLIRESICAYQACTRCIDLHKKGRLTFPDIDEFVDDGGESCLYRLKQLCHDLFRNGSEAHYKEKFCDAIVGYTFHEAMKLREIVYQLEYYKPQYSNLADFQELTPGEEKIVREFDLLIHRGQKRLTEGLKEVKRLLMELVEHLKDLIKLYADNYLLPRFILENEKQLTLIFGKKGYHDLLYQIYEQGHITLLFRAGMSYLESQYYESARALFQKMVNLDRSDRTAKFFLLYASAFNSQFADKLSMARVFTKEAIAASRGVHKVQVYVRSLQNLLVEVDSEIKRETKNKEGSRLTSEIISQGKKGSI
jgi:hypothetical protein